MLSKGHISGIGFGFSNFVIFAVYGLAFWYGGQLVDQLEWRAPASVTDQCPSYVPATYPDVATCVRALDSVEGFGKMIRIFMAIVMSAMGVGQAAGLAPDMAKSESSSESIFKLIDRQSKIDRRRGGNKLPSVTGDITFRDVFFKYPTRDTPIFTGLNLHIPAGTTMALVGDSGGGKSTVIGLLERFYDANGGAVLLDNTEVTTLDLGWLRDQLALVGQEPILFDTTIRENIKYGRPDASDEDMMAAAQTANAHDFISRLPQGYDTPLGDKFTQLSGGQKQRVAIARAIIRNPKILLLDEATSALDSESEQLVQAALDNVMKGRTTIVIAHRLSTIVNAHCIAVVRGGQVVEQGTHQELLDQGGYYTTLISKQMNIH